jgi:hypothetical protein
MLGQQRREENLSWAQTSRNWARDSRNWALIVGLVFFLVDTLFMADGFTSPVSVGSRVLVIFIWLVSLAVVGVLYLRGPAKFSIQNPFVRADTGAHQR